MAETEFKAALPALRQWIDRALATHERAARSVASKGFPRLHRYFSTALLESARFVVVEFVPKPLLSRMGLQEFADFEHRHSDGITYLDTFFVVHACADNEALFFHELIHVLQWRLLGPEKFLLAYADGLKKFKYRASPLEVMAYDADALFVNSGSAFDAEEHVREKWGELKLL